MIGKALKFLLAAGFALLLLGLDINSPFETDQESYYASVIRDVAENGHWLTPLDNYGEICRKPPLYLWLSALVVKATGSSVNETTTRIVSLIAGAVLAGEIVLLAEAHLSPAAGWLAYLFLLGSYGFASQATYAQTDMLMTLFILSAVALAWRLERGAASPWVGYAIGLLLGLAILTKGPLALVLSGLMIMLYRTLIGQNPLALFRRSWVWRATAVACLIGLSWYVAAWFSWRENLLTVHVLEENLGHFPHGQAARRHPTDESCSARLDSGDLGRVASVYLTKVFDSAAKHRNCGARVLQPGKL
jgi:4-amino-4-deoxy-L-arabinose transferase-like glycosyltransferase